jgi:hypothetical protein
MNFKIFYADGSTYAGDVYDAPAFGVLLILESDKAHGRRTVASGDYYVWDGQWFPVDVVGLIDYLARPGAKKVVFGRLVDNDSWNRAWAMAEADKDIPTRTAFGAKERRG